MKVAVRVDASDWIGRGHVERTLNLARALRGDHCDVTFIMRAMPGDAIEHVRDVGFGVVALPAVARPTPGVEGHLAWLGVPVDVEAEQFSLALAELAPEWVVVDHYGIGAEVESAVSAPGRWVLVVDDLADRAHRCDVLVDQNAWPDGGARYRRLIPSGAATLVGPDYALLSNSYRLLHAVPRERSGRPGRLLIAFGSADKTNVTGRCLDAVLSQRDPDLCVDVLLGGRHPHEATLRERAADEPRVVFHQHVPGMARLLFEADAAIGGCGVSAWERVSMGVPSVTLAIASNQEAIGQQLAALGLAHHLGAASDVSGARLSSAIGSLLAGDVAEPSRLVDAAGVDRVASIMLATAGVSPMGVRALGRGADGTRRWGAASSQGESMGTITFRPGVDDQEWVLEATPRWAAVEESSLIRLGALLLPTGAEPEGLPGRGPLPMVRLPGHRAGLRIALCTSPDSWYQRHAADLASHLLAAGHAVQWVHRHEDLQPADVCFLLSYERIVPEAVRCQHRWCVVVHASNLPAGKGWSPVTWSVLAGASQITFTLFSAADGVDSGPVHARTTLTLQGTELVDELREGQARVTARLCNQFIGSVTDGSVVTTAQEGPESFHPRRGPADSRLDVTRPLEEQFDLLRTVDNARYPAWFEHRGHKYIVEIKGAD